MNYPLFIAAGHGLLLILLLGVPAAAIGLAFFGAAALLAARKTKEDMRGAFLFTVMGVILCSILFFSPKLVPLVYWAIGHIGLMK